MKRRGSALLMALWTILVLGVIAMSFAFEAKLQGSINIYVQDKNRGKRLVEAGRIIGEAIIVNYKDVKEPELRGGEYDWSDIFEKEDRWCKEKFELKTATKCTVGPIALDDEKPDSGAVTVEISISKGEEEGSVNINNLYKDGDKNYIMRWQLILDMCGVPREDDFRTEDGKTINLQHRIIACWNDYRDEDDVSTAIEGNTCGAEKKEYEEYYDEHKEDFAEEDRFAPANDELADLKELSRVICFQEYPAVLRGGVLNPWEDKKSQITISRGLMNLGVLSTSAAAKVNVNDCNAASLMTIPGIFDEDEVDEDDKTETRDLADAIVKCRTIMPRDYDVDETRTFWPYKDWQDLCKRISDEFDLEIKSEAQEYFAYIPEDTTIFKMKITVSQLDDEYSAECECYVKDKKVRYVSWKE